MPDDIGSEQFTDEDRAYAGSRFRDVVDALFANPYQQVWGRAGEPPLPDQEVTIRSVFGGLLSLGRPPRFEHASERSLDSNADLRWGPDRKGFTRFLHPNAVCLVGRWQITEDTVYSGYFAGAARRSSSRATRAGLEAIGAGRSGRWRWSANSFQPWIRTTPRRCERRTSSRRRTSAGREPNPSTPPNCGTRRT